MATIARLEAILTADTSHFDRGMARSETTMHKVGRVAGIAGLAIAGGLAFGLEKSVKAAIEAQASQTRLAQAFVSAHLSVKPYAKALDAAESSARKLGFTDTEVRDSLGSLIVATRNYHKAAIDLAVAEDLARFKHVSLGDASKMLTMAMTGSQRAAKQLGITVIPVTAHLDSLKNSHIDLTTASGKALVAHVKLLDKMATGQAVIAQVTEKTHGQGKAFADTAAGGAAQFRAQLDHLEVALGSALLPAITAVIDKLAGLAGYLSAHTTLAKELVGGLAALAGALLTVSVATKIYTAGAAIVRGAVIAWTAAQWALNIALTANPIGIVVVALAGLVAGFIVAWQSSATFRRIATAAFDAVHGAANAVLGFFQDHWKLIAVLISGPFLPLVAVATNMFGIRSALVGAARATASAVEGAFHGISNAIEDAVNWVRRLIEWIAKIPHEINIAVHIAGMGVLHQIAHAGGLLIPPIPHQFGGAVEAMRSYIVGEAGPELFVPRMGGTIVPNHALGVTAGGGGTMIVHNHNYNGPVMQDSQFIAYLRNLEAQFKRRNGRPAFGT